VHGTLIFSLLFRLMLDLYEGVAPVRMRRYLQQLLLGILSTSARAKGLSIGWFVLLDHSTLPIKALWR
jgi:hypothetical protein